MLWLDYKDDERYIESKMSEVREFDYLNVQLLDPVLKEEKIAKQNKNKHNNSNEKKIEKQNSFFSNVDSGKFKTGVENSELSLELFSPTANHISKDGRLQDKFKQLQRKSTLTVKDIVPTLSNDSRKVLEWTTTGPSLEVD